MWMLLRITLPNTLEPEALQYCAWQYRHYMVGRLVSILLAPVMYIVPVGIGECREFGVTRVNYGVPMQYTTHSAGLANKSMTFWHARCAFTGLCRLRPNRIHVHPIGFVQDAYRTDMYGQRGQLPSNECFAPNLYLLSPSLLNALFFGPVCL